MLYGKLTIIDFETPLAATRLPTRRLATSHSEVRDFPLSEGCDFRVGASQIPLGNVSHSELSAGEWDFQIAARKASGRTGGAARSTHWDPRLWRGALAGSHSPRREAPSACSHWEAAPLEPCARHFLRGTFLSKIDLNLA